MNKHINRNIVKSPLFISFAFVVFCAIFLSIFFNKISRDNLTEQIQHRQQLATRVGARSIGAFLRAVGRNTVTLADDPTTERLDKFIQNWGNDGVAGVIHVNKDGIVVGNSNRLGIVDLGVDISTRDYYKWAKTARDGEYLISPPVVSGVGETKGKYVVTIATPVIASGKFNGAVVSAVIVSELVQKHLDGIKVLGTSNIYFVSSNGEVIYSELQDISGMNFKDIFKNDFIGKEKIIEIMGNEIAKNDETKIKLALPNFDNNYRIEPYLVTASPINFDGGMWKVIMSVPQKDLNVFTYNFFNKQIIAVFVLVVLFIVITLKVSHDSGYEQAIIEEHKRHNIK